MGKFAFYNWIDEVARRSIFGHGRDGKKMYADVLLLDVQSISRMEISGQGEVRGRIDSVVTEIV